MAVNGMTAPEYGTFVRLYSRYAGVPTIVYFGADFLPHRATKGAVGWPPKIGKRKLSAVLHFTPSPRFSILRQLACQHAYGAAPKMISEPRPFHSKRSKVVRGPAESAFKAAAERQQIEVLLHIFQKPGFAFYPDYRAMLASIKTGAPGARIVPFVPPETSLMFMSMMSQGRLDDYIHWLSMLVDAFQTVFVFDGVNHFTLDDAHFYDAHHVNTAIGVHSLTLWRVVLRQRRMASVSP